MKLLNKVVVAFVLIHHVCFGQRVVSEHPIVMKGGAQIQFSLAGSKDVRDMVPVIDKKTNEFAIVLIEKKTITCLFYNAAYELVHQISLPNVDKNQDEVLGGFGNNGLYTIFLANDSRTVFSSITFSTKLDEYMSHTFTDIKLEKEKIIDAYSLGDKFLLLTAAKGSAIKAYLLQEEKVEKKVFEFSDPGLKDLYSWLVGPALTNGEGAKSIYNETYNSIGLASAQKKIFHRENEVVITMDDCDPKTERQTRIISLNLETVTSKVNYLMQPGIAGNVAYTNSYIFDDKIFQVSANREEIAVTISDYGTLKSMAEFRAGRNDSIDFKNSPIYQEGGSIYSSGKLKTYDDTGKFLNKINSPGSLMGIAVNPLGGSYEITIGAVKTFQNTSGGPSMGFGVGGSTINTPYGKVTTPPTYNPTQYGYNSYTTSRITYFKSILDKRTLDRTNIRETKNVFDLISHYDEDEGVARTIFKIGDDYILGYYHSKNKVYRLVKF